MERRTRSLLSIFSSSAILPMSQIDRRRYFKAASVMRIIAIAIIGGLLIWLLRDRSGVLVATLAAWVFPGTIITWRAYRRYVVLAPYVWVRDFMTLALLAALSPALLVPAMMCILAILAFCCYTLQRRTTIVLGMLGFLSVTTAGIIDGGEMAITAVVFFPVALAAVMLPTSISAKVVHRHLSINSRIAEGLGLCLWETTDPPGRPDTQYYLYGNSSRLLGEPAGVVLTNALWESLLHPDDIDIGTQIDDAIDSGRDYRVRYRQLHTDGEFRWIEEVGQLQRNDAGVVTNLMGMTQDISRHVRIDQQLTQLDSIVENLDVSVSVGKLVDRDDPLTLTLVYENRMARQLEPDMPRVGHRLVDFNPAAFDTTNHRGLGYVMAEVARGGQPRFYRDAHLRIAAKIRLFSMVLSPLPDDHVGVVLQDLSELHEARVELERLAFNDQLTGLPNRTRLRQLLVDAPVGTVVAVLDLDKFTEINDAFGHACGDEVVIEVANIVSDSPDGVIVARLGGDEFGILVPANLHPGIDIGNRISAALRRPVVLPNGLTLQTSASIGITSKTKTDTTADELLRQADVAMNRAKRFRSGCEIYESRNDTSAPHRMMLMGELRRAIRGHELELYYQPIVDCHTGEIQRLEGVLRWRHPTLGLLQSSDFVEMLELSNLNGEVTLYALTEAVSQVVAWRAAGLPAAVSVNVGGATVQDADLVGRIIELISNAALPPGTIGLELTERHLMLGSGISDQSLRRLAEAGVWLTIDHFGTGSSPLAALRQLPANALKIDKVLIDDLRSGDGSLISAIVTLAHNLGMLLTADGVDDELSLRWLRSNGADLVQGAFVAAPMPAHDIAQLLTPHVQLPLAR